MFKKLRLKELSKSKLKLSGLIILLITLPLIILAVYQIQNARSRAALPDALEIETGVLSSSGVSKQSDSGASGGSYVKFDSKQVTPSPSDSISFPPETTLSTSYSVPSMPVPAYLSPITEPIFGTKLTRVTDPSAYNGDATMRHHYSKVSAWNKDGTRMLMKKYLLDGKTYKVLDNLTFLTGEYRWSNIDPNKINMITSTGRFQIYDIATKQMTVIRDFSGYDEVRMGPWEGNLSSDDSMVVLSGKSGTDYTAIVFDIKNNRVISTKKYPGKWDAGIDWMSISPNGKYVVQNTAYCNPSCAGAVYTLDLNLNQILEISPKGEHGDLTTDLDGYDYFVYVGSRPNGYIAKVRIDTGSKTDIVKLSTYGHISCRNILRPGWCYATLNNSSYKEAIGFKLDGSGTVIRFAHHRSSQSTYDTEAKGVVSMDGAKMLWTSDWGSAGSWFDYVAEAY